MADRIPQTLENCDLRICGEKDAPIAIDIDTPRFALIMAYSISNVDVPKAKDNCRKAECFLTHNRSQSTANSVTNNATINANGTENGVNVMTTKEQEQVKKLLDAIEKKHICNAGILCGTDWSIKKNGFQNFRFFAGKRYFDANRNETKVKSGDQEVGDDYDKGVLI